MARKSENQVENTNVNPQVEENNIEETKNTQEPVIEAPVNQEEQENENTEVTNVNQEEKEIETKDKKDDENQKEAEKVETKVQNKLISNTSFNDKYTGAKYEKGTEFIIEENVEKTTEVSKNQYKISTKRAEQLKASGFVD